MTLDGSSEREYKLVAPSDAATAAAAAEAFHSPENPVPRSNNSTVHAPAPWLNGTKIQLFYLNDAYYHSTYYALGIGEAKSMTAFLVTTYE